SEHSCRDFNTRIIILFIGPQPVAQAEGPGAQCNADRPGNPDDRPLTNNASGTSRAGLRTSSARLAISSNPRKTKNRSAAAATTAGNTAAGADTAGPS